MQYALLKRQSDWQTKWSERNAGHWYRSCFSVFGGKVLSQQWSQKWSWREKTNTSYQTGTTSFADAGGKRRWLRNAACIVTGNFFWICLRIWVMIFDAQKGWHWVQRINIQERLLDVGETSLWSDFSAETWRRVHFHLLMRTSETSRIFPWSFDWTFKHWQLNRPSIWFEHPSQESRGALVVGYWSDFADDWFVKDVLSHHTTETVRDIILNIAGIAWYYVDRGSAQTASPQTGDCVHHSPTRRAKDDLQRWSFRLHLGQSQTSRRPTMRSMWVTNRKSSAGYSRWWWWCRLYETFASHVHPEVTRRSVTTPIIVDSYAVLNRLDKTVYRYIRTSDKGKDILTALRKRRHDRSWINAQLALLKYRISTSNVMTA